MSATRLTGEPAHTFRLVPLKEDDGAGGLLEGVKLSAAIEEQIVPPADTHTLSQVPQPEILTSVTFCCAAATFGLLMQMIWSRGTSGRSSERPGLTKVLTAVSQS